MSPSDGYDPPSDDRQPNPRLTRPAADRSLRLKKRTHRKVASDASRTTIVISSGDEPKPKRRKGKRSAALVKLSAHRRQKAADHCQYDNQPRVNR
ncbi:hypothetical protein LSAT2_032418 [Lamellibrachia satsuma]|nr:hypothetical protein LSAT2_032418 [Lamellibrachia satsuma]